ncbi:Sulfur carrier protein FdhD [Planktothrix tepida]|uniref:Sulfur carrier protein FdhD n=2 Tax=Planktothrix TaxID=54304 RepID=A0A1J1LHT5_9CYAN|nr:MULTISPECIES: formate dehydrogenase accessory sulfurtransferase FdhD [Planktothrix]CAD5910858.1 Sulfur carrier protein FdhD [Planktothrix pseudagardhii]CAD5911692.1 Sulfur carrier protein FdhD [Planktothrix tepida]CUR32043.1 Protein FdhD homolog [Planktothrix tepida PCC 9214]
MNTGNSKIKAKIWVVFEGKERSRFDELATEEPLEIRLSPTNKTLAVTMRTPGADFELVAGFLYSEGMIKNKSDIVKMSYCVDPNIDGEQQQNIVNVALKPELNLDFKSLERHFFTNSSCGVCGKASIESLEQKGCPILTEDWHVTANIIYNLPEQLNQAQSVFHKTGGLHAAALFNPEGNLLKLREDVGRHNALDKLIGSAFLADELPLNQGMIMVSGRTSFEIIQKCLMAKIPIICAVSAPSSLAVSLAQAFNLTLIGFLRGQRFNVYSGLSRLRF